VDVPREARDRVKLVIGLGNPGSKYGGTRHNIGFDVVDEVARRLGLAFESGPGDAVIARERGDGAQLILAKPMTFMNRSGEAVGVVSRYFRIKVDDILIVVDDVNLPLGRLRARQDGSDGGHNGLRSVMLSLATREFSRLRVGVGRGETRLDLAGHVLSRFATGEIAMIDEMMMRAADAAELFVESGMTAVMNRFNATERSDKTTDSNG
jgi:PTH1 family peptidyl-tRNA hydrolase